MLILNVLQGPDRGRRFELPDNEPQLIGRSSEALPLTDQTISRRHAELTPDDGKWFINDLRSSNGTYVNGQRVGRRRLLQFGDQIKAGKTVFVFGNEPASLRPDPVRLATAGEVDVAVSHRVVANEESMIMAVPDPSEAAVVQLRIIYELTQLIGATLEKQDLLDKVMDLIFEHFKADRGFILLMDSLEKKPEPAVVRHRVKPKRSEDQRITVSRTIIQHVVKHGEGVLSSNAMADRRFAGGDSVRAYGIHSAICVPIAFKDRLFGVIHIDSQVANYTYTEDQARLLTAIGVQTGLAMANAQLMDERLERERLAAVGQTVASLSHSVKNMLQGLRGGADVVELGLRKDKMQVVHSGWEIVSRNLERIYALTMNMLAFSKQRKPEVEMTSLPKLLDDVVELMQKQFDNKNVALITDFDHDMPPVEIDPLGIHQAVLNLVNNALDAAPPTTGAVSLRCQYVAEPQSVRLSVSDNGPGIDPEHRARLFEPFQSTKGQRGTGLGLVVTRKIALEHGGTLEVEERGEGGTTFTIVLPLGQPSAPVSSDTQGPGAAAETPRS